MHLLTNQAVNWSFLFFFLSLDGDDENVVPGRTTPFPDIIRITPAPGVLPSITPTPGGEEIRGGEVDILTPLPVPPSMTEIDAPMGPKGH